MSTVKSLINGFVGLDGVPVLLHEGEERDAEDALVLARPDLFSEPATEPQRTARGRAKDAKSADD